MRVTRVAPGASILNPSDSRRGRVCYDLWKRCIGCSNALNCRDCLYSENEIKAHYPEWYAQLLYYRKVRSKGVRSKKASAVFIDELHNSMEGDDTNGIYN